MIGSLISQSLALVIVLTPGLLFLFGYHAAPLQWPARRPLQSNLLFDAALFALTSVSLHLLVGRATVAVLDWLLDCSVIETATNLLFHGATAPAKACSPAQDYWIVVAYLATISAIAFAAGNVTARQIARRPAFFRAIYGPFFETFSDSQAFVIANVLTDVAHEGRYLAYEGELIEISISAGNSINHVCLAGAKRFLLAFDEAGTRTTPREDFVDIDRGSLKSRITIPGERVVNILTRTYPIAIGPDALAD